MANLKDLKNRIKSVKSTQKITKAMKMVAASKLKRAHERAMSARPYSSKMERVLVTLAKNADLDNSPALLSGRRSESGDIEDNTHLIIVATADRGLCGAFNSSIVKMAKQRIMSLENEGKRVKLMAVGKKGRDMLRHGFEKYITEKISFAGKKNPEFFDAEDIARKVVVLFETGEIDSCSIIYNKFVSALVQKVTAQRLIPLDIEALFDGEDESDNNNMDVYDYEPGEEAILSKLLPLNIAVQVYHGMLENMASEQGARMTAMDNATRNAGEMIKDLTLVYNRTRQAAITTELTEIISGAEAL